MKIVVIESPYAGDIEKNVEYARRAMLHCLQRGEAPYASHLLYTQVWDDTVPELRTAGIAAGIAYHAKADVIAFYVDLGWSKGMLAAKEHAVRNGYTIEERTLNR